MRSRTFVVQVDDARTERPRLHELQLNASVDRRPEPPSSADDHGVDERLKVIDQPELDRLGRQLGSADPDVLPGSFLQLGSLFGDKVQGLTHMNKGTSLLTALAAGFAVGVSPKLRSLLWRIIKKLT